MLHLEDSFDLGKKSEDEIDLGLTDFDMMVRDSNWSMWMSSEAVGWNDEKVHHW